MEIDSKWISVKKGKVLRGQGKTDEAIACFNEALALDPEYIEALKERADTYSNTDYIKPGKFDEAIDDYSKIIRIKPDFIEAYIGRARTYALKGDTAQAIADLTYVTGTHPSWTEAYRILGDIYRKKGGGSGGLFDGETATKGATYRRYREIFEPFNFTGEVKEALERELEKLNLVSDNDLPFDSNNFAVTQNYLDTVFALPWDDPPPEQFSLKDAAGILDEDHYGLKDVKTRIPEYLAVRKQKKRCQGGYPLPGRPPGVGKTSVGKSIARAMNKAFFRFSVGGMSDEAELRGHRRTYIGAQPGQIIKGLKAKKTKSPVCLIDEVDKMSHNSWQGNPYSALLEVLDPEQNNTFRDNYIDLPFDLSNVFFILTANEHSPIPEPVLDRMEIIEIPGYNDTE
jgi:tetratricopeptide (TPR) repeat protein